MKRSVLGILAVAGMFAGLTGCGNEGAGSGYQDWVEENHTKPAVQATDGGSVVNIQCWNNEFEGRFENFYPEAVKVEGDTYTMPSKHGDGTVTVKFIITPNDNNGYQNALDAALKSQSSASADNKVDMFLMEADYALKYANSDYSLDVHDLGLTDAEMSDMYGYTKQIATDTRKGMNSALKGVSWQAAPGLFAYRTDFAEEAFGSSDPVEVQKRLADWDKFNAAAATMKDKGHYMISGNDDAFRTFSNNVSSAWIKKYVDVDGVKTNLVTLDPQIKSWIKQTKEYNEKNYSHATSLWDSDWSKDQGPDGNVFGFFYSTWGINFTLKDNSLATSIKDGGKYELGNGLYGKYRVCEGPASYYWGGTWLVGAQGTDNKSEVADIMRKLTCDKDIAEKITRETEDYTNNKTAMHKLATDSEYGSAFLGGQNHVALFEKSAAKISMNGMSPIDQTCNEQIQNAMKDFYSGKSSYKDCIAAFKTKVIEKEPGTVFDETFDADL